MLREYSRLIGRLYASPAAKPAPPTAMAKRPIVHFGDEYEPSGGLLLSAFNEELSVLLHREPPSRTGTLFRPSLIAEEVKTFEQNILACAELSDDLKYD